MPPARPLKTKARISSAGPTHTALDFTKGSSTFEYGKVVKTKWTAIPSAKQPDPKQDHYDYIVTITFPGTPPKDALSMATLGLQGSHHKIELDLDANSNAQIGKQDAKIVPEGIDWNAYKPGKPIPAIGFDRFSGRRRLKQKNIWFIKPIDSTKPIVLKVRSLNTKIVERHENRHDHKVGHDTVPPPFPPGSSEGD